MVCPLSCSPCFIHGKYALWGGLLAKMNSYDSAVVWISKAYADSRDSNNGTCRQNYNMSSVGII